MRDAESVLAAFARFPCITAQCQIKTHLCDSGLGGLFLLQAYDDGLVRSNLGQRHLWWYKEESNCGNKEL